MSRFLKNIQQNKARQYINLASLILITLISVHSIFAVYDSCSTVLASEGINESVNEARLQSSSVTCKEIELVTNEFLVNDDCIDCDGNCCPCCSNIIFTLADINIEAKTSELSNFIFEPIQFSPPYFILLRPPKLSHFHIT